MMTAWPRVFHWLLAMRLLLTWAGSQLMLPSQCTSQHLFLALQLRLVRGRSTLLLLLLLLLLPAVGTAAQPLRALLLRTTTANPVLTSALLMLSARQRSQQPVSALRLRVVQDGSTLLQLLLLLLHALLAAVLPWWALLQRLRCEGLPLMLTARRTAVQPLLALLLRTKHKRLQQAAARRRPVPAHRPTPPLHKRAPVPLAHHMSRCLPHTHRVA